MFDWEIELAESKRKFEAEMDADQDKCYNEFLERLGLEHTEDLWDTFIEVWVAGEGWGESREYSYPS